MIRLIRSRKFALPPRKGSNSMTAEALAKQVDRNRQAHEHEIAPVERLYHRASLVIILFYLADEDPRDRELKQREAHTVQHEICVHVLPDVPVVEIIEHHKRIEGEKYDMCKSLYLKEVSTH